jgi:hypothetical protein
MVGKTSRCFALACLLALTFLLPTAPLQAGEHPRAESAEPRWSPLERLWQMIVSASCEHGINIGPGQSCNRPVSESGCDRGPLIDPNGRCSH